MNSLAFLRGSHHHLGRIIDAAARLVFPPQCAACDAYLGGAPSFCERCEYAVFGLKDPRCSICGETRETHPGAYSGGDATCGHCIEKRPQYDRARAFWEYSGSVADAIQRAKYGQRLWIARNLAAELAPWFRQEIEGINEELRSDEVFDRPAPLQVICVPMHPKDLRARGFNFAYLLLRACQKSAGYAPEIADLLIKTRQTRSQAGLGHLDRQINLRGAFICRPHADVAGRPVLLFDDVLTTGATANEVAKTLRKAGASRVFVLSAARALKY